jgi:hypothetical protein
MALGLRVNGHHFTSSGDDSTNRGRAWESGGQARLPEAQSALWAKFLKKYQITRAGMESVLQVIAHRSSKMIGTISDLAPKKA